MALITCDKHIQPKCALLSFRSCNYPFNVVCMSHSFPKFSFSFHSHYHFPFSSCSYPLDVVSIHFPFFILIPSSCGDKSVDPVPCQQGSYAPSGQMSCLPCPIGSHCPSSKLSKHIPCSNGTTALAVNQTSCDPCPAGSKCIDATISPVACDSGYYSKGGATQCIVCPEGHR